MCCKMGIDEQERGPIYVQTNADYRYNVRSSLSQGERDTGIGLLRTAPFVANSASDETGCNTPMIGT